VKKARSPLAQAKLSRFSFLGRDRPHQFITFGKGNVKVILFVYFVISLCHRVVCFFEPQHDGTEERKGKKRKREIN